MYKGRRVLVLSVSALLILCVGAAVAFSIYSTNYRSNVEERFRLYVTPQMSCAEFADSLSGYLVNPNSFKRVFKRENPSGKLESGYYVINKGANNKSIVRTFKNGWQTPYRLTLSGNIRGVEKLASILGKRLMADSASFSNWFNNPECWERYGLTKETFVSLFIPDTYEIYWSISPEQFTDRMAKEYQKFWNSERMEKAAELGMSREEVSTLASIVCEESNYGPELATIAGVYINRLKRGMKLEADPTVKFALNDPAIKRILFKHLKVESPYNTYLVYGLPPGPITIPSARGIDAVLNYQRHNYLYFCANSTLDGTHNFAKSLAEHNRNARAYQKAISKLKL